MLPISNVIESDNFQNLAWEYEERKQIETSQTTRSVAESNPPFPPKKKKRLLENTEIEKAS